MNGPKLSPLTVRLLNGMATGKPLAAFHPDFVHEVDSFFRASGLHRGPALDSDELRLIAAAVRALALADHQERTAVPLLSDPSDFESSTIGFVERLMILATDHLLALATVTDSESPPVFAHQSLLRTIVEATSLVWWILEPLDTHNPGSPHRNHFVSRYMNERLAKIRAADRNLTREPLKSFVEGHLDAGTTEEMLADQDFKKTEISDWATSLGIPLVTQRGNAAKDGDFVGEPRPKVMNRVAAIFDLAVARAGLGSGRLHGLRIYETASEIVHASPDATERNVTVNGGLAIRPTTYAFAVSLDSYIEAAERWHRIAGITPEPLGPWNLAKSGLAAASSDLRDAAESFEEATFVNGR